MKAGWNWLLNARKWHYFHEDGRSLCGKWWMMGHNDDAKPEAEVREISRCAECKRRLAKEKA